MEEPGGQFSSTARCGARGATGRGRRRGAARGRPRRGRARERPDALRAPGRRLGADRMSLAVLIVVAVTDHGDRRPRGRVRCASCANTNVARVPAGRVMKQRGPARPCSCRRGPDGARGLRTVTLRSGEDLITRDNVPARVTAVAYYRVIDPTRSVIEIENVLAPSADRSDDAPLGAGQGRARLAPSPTRAPQREPPADHRRPDRARASGHDRRDQGRRVPSGCSARSPSGRGRARARAKVINAEGEYEAAAG